MVRAALAELGIDTRSLDPANRQEAGVFLLRGTDDTGEAIVVKIYGRDAHDTQLLATLWHTVWYRRPGSPLTFGRRQQVANEGFVTLLASQAGVSTDIVVTAGVTAEDDALLVLRPLGAPWAQAAPGAADEERLVARLWAAVARLHSVGIAHGQLDAEHIVLVEGDGDPDVGFVDFRRAEVGASDDRLRTDEAQAFVTSVLAIGPQQRWARRPRLSAPKARPPCSPTCNLRCSHRCSVPR